VLALKARPTTKEMGPLAESWRPWRGAAAYLLWTYYRTARQRDGAPIQAVPNATPDATPSTTPSATLKVTPKASRARRANG
jgi:DNA-3-methyladenine glycosylase II